MKNKAYKIILVLFALFSISYSFAQPARIDSLYRLSVSEQEDTSRVLLWLEIASLYNDIDSVQLYVDKSLFLSQNVGYAEGEGRAYDVLGSKYSDKGDQQLALSYYLKTIDRRDEYSDYLITRALTGLGIVYYRLKNMDRAIEYYKEAIKISKRTKNQKALGALYNNLAIIYGGEGELSIALTYYEKTLASLEYVSIDRERYMRSIVMLNTADIYIKQKKYEQALSAAQESENLAIILENEHILAHVYQLFGHLYKELNDYTLSLEYFDKSMVFGLEQGNNIILSELHEELADLEMRRGNYEEALMFYQKHIQYRDTVEGAEVKKQLNELSVKYESEKQKQELALKDVQLAKDAVNMKLYLGGLVVVLLFSVFLVVGYFRKKKTNQELEKLSIVASETDNVVIISDGEGKLEWVNPGFTRIYGYTLAEFIEEVGDSLQQISGDMDIRDHIDAVRVEKKTVQYSGVNTNRSGGEFWTQTTLTPILNKQGGVRKIVAIDSDISVLKEAEQEIQLQKEELIKRQGLISDSIDYAKRIQQAVFPTLTEITGVFPNSFVYLQPKDVVSGDFYWTYETDESKYFAVVDCTGHGVPGAFMTIIGINILNELVGEKITHTDEIICGLNTKLRSRLSAGSERLKDGMDMALIRIDKATNELEFSGSHLSCYISSKEGVKELKGSKSFIGMDEVIIVDKVTSKLDSGDEVFLFTDGYPDQKGGKRNKKFYYKPLVDMLGNMYDLPAEQQRQRLLLEFVDWKGNNEQIDDILIAGIKFQ